MRSIAISCLLQTESEYSTEEQARLTGGGPDDGLGDDPANSPEEEAGSLCEYHDIPPPPDGGYGWVIVFASFMCNMIVDGIAYTFGVFLSDLCTYFDESKSKVTWAGSLLSGVYLMAGPVVSALTNKYGCRVVCIAGSILGTLAFILSTFAKSVTMLMMTYGVLGVPTVPTLPTISEVKVQEHSSSGATSHSGSSDLKSSSIKSRSRKGIDEPAKDEQTTSAAATGSSTIKAVLESSTEQGASKSAAIPRNASQPAFTTHVQGLPKNGSVPFFDRIRKTSTGERYKPSLSAIKNSRTTLNSNGDIRKSFNLRLSNSSMLGSRNNNADLDGVEKKQASFLVSVIGITNTIGRVACGYVADFPQVDSLLLNNICLIVATVAVSLTPLCTTTMHYMIMSTFFGIAISGYISLTSIILVDLLGLDKLTNAFGLLILFRGVAAIAGPPMAGTLYDLTNDYGITFYMGGFCFLISTITSFVAPMMKRCITPQTQPVILDTLTPIDEDIEEENEDDIPEIIETAPSPQEQPEKEIKQIESVL
ncbi:unnamed protein product [Trichogramma brassicae]|uniref:Major facilitator superfamily (MFS) profile domain-containing protein n=1 Tax=Trichogramma brassicae TaxID=86971 RepID=A0A6H5J433_9HYME|nr:unnamed protein product [Trichogramma brassicae]